MNGPKNIRNAKLAEQLIQHLERRNCISLVLTHLLSFLIQDKVVNEYVSVRSLSGNDGGYCHEGVEPSSGLVDTFADEVCREEFIEIVLVLERIVPLSERH